MARTAEDVAILLNALAGHDPRDPSTATTPVEDYTAKLGLGVKGLRIALPVNFFFDKITDDARAAFNTAVEVFRDLGATVEEVSIPQGELAGCTRAVMLPEAYAYHARDLAELPEKYPDQLRNQFRSGALYLGSEYVQAQRARAILKQSYQQVLTAYDVMLTPSQTSDAPSYNEMIDPKFKRGPSYTGAFNMTGLPSMSIPAGFSSRGLPLSIMISGRPFAESTVLRIAQAYQGATSWHTQHPDLDAPARPPESSTATASAGESSEPALITPNVVRQRAAAAGVKIDELWLEEVATSMETALAPLRTLDPRAIRLVEPAVGFSAAW
jgi:aspartyl-tRNA(Asn)/glutamyl-tRNA(Gln) amidotransferase subunit A